LPLFERHAPSDGVFETALPSLGLVRLSQRVEQIHSVQRPALCLILQGRKRITVGTEVYDYDPERFLLVSIDLPLKGEIIEASPECPYLGMRLDIDPKAVSEFLASGISTDSPSGRGLGVSPLDPDLRASIGRLLSLLDSPEHAPALAPLIEREILYRLLVGPQGGRLREIALAWSGANRVAQAVALLRRDYALPLRIEAIAREVGMSPSSLHHHFKAVTAMSPLQFQKQLRLQEARRLIVTEGLDAASAAFRVGYESPSQFSREYRRLFGAPPIRDATRLRAAPALGY